MPVRLYQSDGSPVTADYLWPVILRISSGIGSSPGSARACSANLWVAVSPASCVGVSNRPATQVGRKCRAKAMRSVLTCEPGRGESVA